MVVNLVMNGVDAMATITDRPREIVIQSQPHETPKCLWPCGILASGLTGERGPALQRLLHHQTQRDGNGAVDQSLNHHGPRRQIVGLAKPGPRRSFSIHRTD